jgi:uncharacterized protein (TIRG00374 family)
MKKYLFNDFKRIAFFAILASVSIYTLVIGLSPYINRLNSLVISPIYLILATLMLLTATLLRAMRTKILISIAAPTTLSENVTAWSISSVINMLLPFRIGEAYRVIYLRKITNISGVYILGVIILERILDLSLIFLVTIFASTTKKNNFNSLVLIVFYTSVIVIFLIYIYFIKKKLYFFGRITKITENFNPELKWRIKHSLWVALHGFDKFFHAPRKIFQYVFLTLSSWSLYFSAVIIVLRPFVNLNNLSAIIISPFNDFDSFSKQSPSSYIAQISQAIPTQNVGIIANASGVLWLVLNGPLIFWAILQIPKVFFAQDKKQNADNSLSRSAKFDEKNRSILDYYLSNYQVMSDTANWESDIGARTVTVFNGGSEAVTSLLEKSDGKKLVYKAIEISKREKLAMQYRWLKKFRKFPEIVDAGVEMERRHSYGYTLEYAEDAIGFFDYIHRNSVHESSEIIERIFCFLGNSVYTNPRNNLQKDMYESYFVKRVLSPVENIISKSHFLNAVWNHEFIFINGTKCENILHLFQSRKTEINNSLTNFIRTDHIHGDLTIDNILIIDRKPNFLLIDPSDNNTLCGPVLDFSRILQSLSGGFEFLKYSPSETKVKFGTDPILNFADIRTVKYLQLELSVRELASKNLNEFDFKNLDLHVGLLFLRVMVHQLRIDENYLPLYYAKACEFLNRWKDGE